MAEPLLAKVIDKLDAVLFEYDLEFREDADWEAFAEKLRALIYENYDDHGGDDDGEFDPEAPEESSSESESLDHSATAEEGEKKRKR